MKMTKEIEAVVDNIFEKTNLISKKLIMLFSEEIIKNKLNGLEFLGATNVIAIKFINAICRGNVLFLEESENNKEKILRCIEATRQYFIDEIDRIFSEIKNKTNQ